MSEACRRHVRNVLHMHCVRLVYVDVHPSVGVPQFPSCLVSKDFLSRLQKFLEVYVSYIKNKLNKLNPQVILRALDLQKMTIWWSKENMQKLINDPLSEYHEIRKINHPELIVGMHSQTPNTMKFGSKNA